MAEAKKQNGAGNTITLNFANHKDHLQYIRDAAKADERDVASWLRRFIVQKLDERVNPKKEVQ